MLETTNQTEVQDALPGFPPQTEEKILIDETPAATAPVAEPDPAPRRKRRTQLEILIDLKAKAAQAQEDVRLAEAAIGTAPPVATPETASAPEAPAESAQAAPGENAGAHPENPSFSFKLFPVDMKKMLENMANDVSAGPDTCGNQECEACNPGPSAESSEPWEALSAEQKIERMRIVVKKQGEEIGHLESRFADKTSMLSDFLRMHAHGDGGRLVVPIEIAMSVANDASYSRSRPSGAEIAAEARKPWF